MTAPPSVAIVLSGAYRTLPDCNASIVEHVIRANPQVKFDVFAHLTTEGASKAEHQQAERAAWSTFPCVANVLFESNAAVTAEVRADIVGTDSLPRGRGTARGKAMNIIKMFRGIEIAQRLLDRGGSGGAAVAGNARRGIGCATPSKADGSTPLRARDYDLVLRLRPDLCFCGALDLAPMLARPAHHLWLPWWSERVGWAFDQIAVGAPATMRAYARAYGTTVRRLVAERRELYPEAVMWAHLQTLGPSARHLRPLRNFRASLARKQPTFHLEDPYSKLKQDLAVVAPAAEPTPLWACAPTPSPRTSGGSGGGGGKRVSGGGGGGGSGSGKMRRRLGLRGYHRHEA